MNQEALEAFPVRYFDADSGLDEVNMLGKFAPMLIMAVVTTGGSAAVEGTDGAAAIAEEMGGEAGTLERLSVLLGCMASQRYLILIRVFSLPVMSLQES